MARTRTPPAELDPQRQFELGLEYAVRSLAASARTEAELRRSLARRGYDEDVVDRILAQLRQWRYVDDAAYAQEWARGRKRSRTAIRAELSRKGIDRELIQAATAQIDDEDEQERADRFAATKFRSVPDRLRDDEQAVRRRLFGMLARRGFSPDVSRRAVDSALHTD